MAKARHLLWWRRWRRWRSKRSNEQHREATRAGLVMWCNTRELVERERERERAISSIDGLEEDDEYREKPH